MAIPIKTQLNLGTCNEQWKNITILTDGSIYMVDVDFKVHPVDRSYAGQAIKDHMKQIASDYHKHMFFASSARKMGDLINADFFRGTAECIDVEYKQVKKFWNVFQQMSPKKKKKADTSTTNHMTNNYSTTWTTSASVVYNGPIWHFKGGYTQSTATDRYNLNP